MGMRWEGYIGRRRIDILQWAEDRNIKSYKDFCVALRKEDIIYPDKSHPDVVYLLDHINKKKKENQMRSSSLKRRVLKEKKKEKSIPESIENCKESFEKPPGEEEKSPETTSTYGNSKIKKPKTQRVPRKRTRKSSKKK